MIRHKNSPSTFELLARLPQQIVNLAKLEFENAKREVVKKLKRAGIGAGAVFIALFFLFFMLEALVLAAIFAFALIMPWWLAALTVAGILLLLAVCAIAGGVWLLKRGNPVPTETLGRVEGDLGALAEVRINGGTADASAHGAGSSRAAAGSAGAGTSAGGHTPSAGKSGGKDGGKGGQEGATK